MDNRTHYLIIVGPVAAELLHEAFKREFEKDFDVIIEPEEKPIQKQMALTEETYPFLTDKDIMEMQIFADIEDDDRKEDHCYRNKHFNKKQNAYFKKTFTGKKANLGGGRANSRTRKKVLQSRRRNNTLPRYR